VLSVYDDSLNGRKLLLTGFSFIFVVVVTRDETLKGDLMGIGA
jgi:hypothetical protein